MNIKLIKLNAKFILILLIGECEVSVKCFVWKIKRICAYPSVTDLTLRAYFLKF